MLVIYIMIMIGISFFSSIGGIFCALMERSVTGKVQMENPFTSRRKKSLVVSLIISPILATIAASRMHVLTDTGINWTILLVSIAIGLAVFLLIHLTNYRIFLEQYRK